MDLQIYVVTAWPLHPTLKEAFIWKSLNTNTDFNTDYFCKLARRSFDKPDWDGDFYKQINYTCQWSVMLPTHDCILRGKASESSAQSKSSIHIEAEWRIYTSIN